MLKWKIKYIESISEMSNHDLFDEYIYLLTDVDNDAVRLDNSEWKLKKVHTKLMAKLLECGFFNVDIK